MDGYNQVHLQVFVEVRKHNLVLKCSKAPIDRAEIRNGSTTLCKFLARLVGRIPAGPRQLVLGYAPPLPSILLSSGSFLSLSLLKVFRLSLSPIRLSFHKYILPSQAIGQWLSPPLFSGSLLSLLKKCLYFINRFCSYFSTSVSQSNFPSIKRPWIQHLRHMS